MTTSSQKVLVYLIGSLGDTVVAIPAIRAVARHFAGAELVLLQNVGAEGVVQAIDVVPSELICRSVEYKTRGGMSGFYRLWKLLRRERFRAVVYLVISERSSRAVARDKLFFKLCGIRNAYGFHAFSKTELYPVNDAGAPDATEHESIRKLRRLESDGIKSVPEDDFREPMIRPSPDETRGVVSWLTKHRRQPDARLVAVAPSCKTPANAWPVENFVELGHRLLVTGVEIVVVGGKADAEVCRQVSDQLDNAVNAAGLFSVQESAALLAACDVLVGLDTGTTHLAAAVGTPTFSIYHQRDNPGQWFPLGSNHTVIQHAVECAGCRGLKCRVTGHPCMNAIQPETVWPLLEDFMANLDKEHRRGVEVRLV